MDAGRDAFNKIRRNDISANIQNQPDDDQQDSNHERNDDFCRLISEMLQEPNSIETWQATNALENINNNVDDNYNNNYSNESMPTNKLNIIKKTTKKRTTKLEKSPKPPPKKRGRKVGSKNSRKLAAQLNITPEGEKSDLAKYVELFSNDCDLASNAPTATLSSRTASTPQHIVTSTTQNFDETGQTSSNGTQTPQITYLLNTACTTCQLVSSANIGNIISLDSAHITQDDFNYNTPFDEDFVSAT